MVVARMLCMLVNISLFDELFLEFFPSLVMMVLVLLSGMPPMYFDPVTVMIAV